MENMEAIIAGIEDSSSGEGSVIVVERNKKALAVLGKRLDAGEKKLGIFYGGAHMPDMESRLVSEFKLRRSQVKWFTAWSIRKKTQAKPDDWFQRFLKPGGSEPEKAGSSRDRRSSGRGER